MCDLDVSGEVMGRGGGNSRTERMTHDVVRSVLATVGSATDNSAEHSIVSEVGVTDDVGAAYVSTLVGVLMHVYL